MRSVQLIISTWFILLLAISLPLESIVENIHPSQQDTHLVINWKEGKSKKVKKLFEEPARSETEFAEAADLTSSGMTEPGDDLCPDVYMPPETPPPEYRLL